MEHFETSIPGVYEIRPAYSMTRAAFLMEAYHQQKFPSLGMDGCFVPDNHSRSTKGTLRRLYSLQPFESIDRQIKRA
jgi:dTDP-4-dehydrorhamnose 3,5-epimerase